MGAGGPAARLFALHGQDSTSWGGCRPRDLLGFASETLLEHLVKPAGDDGPDFRAVHRESSKPFKGTAVDRDLLGAHERQLSAASAELHQRFGNDPEPVGQRPPAS